MVTESFITADPSAKTKASPKPLKGAMKVIKKLKGRIGLDLTSRPGFWGKALPERYVDVGVLFAFHFTAGGDVVLNVDGHDKGVFLTGVDARTPLWVMVDIYGNTTAVQFVDPRGSLNNMRNSPSRRSTTSLQSTASSGSAAGVPGINNRPNHQHMSRPRSEADLLVSMNALNLNRGGPNQIPSLPLPPIPGTSLPPPPVQQQPPVLQNFPPPPPLRHYRHTAFQPLTLHPRTHGINIRLGSDCRTAVRHDAEFCNGYVLSSRPINPGESWVVQIVQTESIYVGGMGFGFTTCNPASLSPTDLPDDADQLLDRPEYWVISKDVAHGPMLGDEIEFHLSHNGEVTMMKNRGPPAFLMHVDISLPLWAIFDVYGSTRAMRLLGTICPSQVPAEQHHPTQRVSPPRHQQPQPIYQQIPAPVLSSGTASYVETVNQSLTCQAGGGVGSECTVCYERETDCVLYSCGHMCLCYDCALTLYRGGRGICPICRAPIRDVIRAYRS
nr:EOG090X03H5 [Ilyocryptus agilis]